MATASLSKEMQFFIDLIERYAEAKNSTANQILAQWEALKLTQFIFDLYDLYHIERLENAFADIDQLIAARLKNTPA